MIAPKLLRQLDNLFEKQQEPFQINLPSGKTLLIMDKEHYDSLLAQTLVSQDNTTPADDVLAMLDV